MLHPTTGVLVWWGLHLHRRRSSCGHFDKLSDRKGMRYNSLLHHILQGCYYGIHGGFRWIMARVWNYLASNGVVAFADF